MAGHNKVQWTESEQDKVLTPMMALMRERRMPIMEAINAAQIGALPEHRRRRHLKGISHIPKYLRDRLIVNGLLDKDWETHGRRRHEPDPRDERIAALEAEVGEAQREAFDHKLRAANLEARVKALEAQPSPAEAVQQFIARAIAMGLGMAAERPAALAAHDPAAQRRHNPEMMPEAGKYVPRIVLVGGKAEDHARVKQDVGEHNAEIRFYTAVDSQAQQDAIKKVVLEGGRIVYWSDHAAPGCELVLKRMGCGYKMHRGNLSSVVEKIRGSVIEMRAKHAAA
jgi:hypothetical protein